MTDATIVAEFFTQTREAQIALTTEGDILAWNPAAARLLQIDASEAVGRSLPALLPTLGDLVDSVPASTPPGSAGSCQRRSLTLPHGGVLAVEVGLVRHGDHLLLMLAPATPEPEAAPAAQDVDHFYQAMLDALPIGFTIVSLRDAGYPTRYQNDWGGDVSGWGNDEWERDPDFTLRILHPDDREAMLTFRETFRAAPGAFDITYRVVRPDGGVVWLRDWGTIVRDAAGQPDHLVICLLDVTAQKSAEQALRDSLHDLSLAHAEVEALSHAKSEYLSFVSHELRTPLTSIQGFSELLAGGGTPDAEVREFGRIIQSNAQRLARMISDLLAMDRLESGRSRVRLSATRLDTLILEVLESLAGLGHTHHVALDIAEDLPVIQADSDLLTQVLTNLFSNAMKYTPAEGNILIEIARSGCDAVEARITDTGPGIPPEALETIFQRFARLPRDERSQIVGSGLGLPIARQIAELHGGRLWAEEAAHGACFVLRLPVAGPNAPPEADHL